MHNGIGHVMGQTVSCETVTAEARVQSGANICETFRAERDNLTGFSLSVSQYVICIIPANVLHSNLSTMLSN